MNKKLLNILTRLVKMFKLLDRFKIPFMIDLQSKKQSAPVFAGKKIEVKGRGIRKVIIVRRRNNGRH